MESEIWLNFGSFAYAFQAQALSYRREELIVRWLPRNEATAEINEQQRHHEDLRSFTAFLQLIQEKSRSLLLTEVRVFFETEQVSAPSPVSRTKTLRMISQLPPVVSSDLSAQTEDEAGVSLTIRYLTPASAADTDLLDLALDHGWLRQ